VKVTQASEDRWRADAYSVVPIPWPDFSVADPRGMRLTIRPFAAWYADITVIGGDWLPINSNGEVLIDHMIHTPWRCLQRLQAQSGSGELSVELGDLLSCDTPAVLLGGSANYYHWFIDYLPRIMLLGHERIQSLRIIVQSELTAFQLDSLALLGIDQSKLFRVATQQAVRVKALLLSNLLASTTVVHPRLPRLMRTLLCEPDRAQQGQRKIFLSRRDASRRRLINEADLLEVLAKWGFEVHVPGEMSLQAQMTLCAQASVICAVHGAALVNMVFAPPGCQVVEIACTEYRVSSMKILAKMCGHTYVSLNADVAVPSEDGNPLLADWVMSDLDKAELELRRCLG